MNFHCIAGDVDFVVIVVASDIAIYEAFTHRFIFADKNAREFRTSIVVSPEKATLEPPQGCLVRSLHPISISRTLDRVQHGLARGMDVLCQKRTSRVSVPCQTAINQRAMFCVRAGGVVQLYSRHMEIPF